MNVFVADLNEAASGFGEQVSRDGEAIPQIGKVGIDAVAPRIAKGFDHLGLLRDVLAVLNVGGGCGPLEIGIEFDPVRRVDVDALHFPAQAFALGERSHDLERIAENHAICPILVVAVKVCFIGICGNAVEIAEEVGKLAGVFSGAAAQVVDEKLRMNFFLNVKRRSLDDERSRVVLFVLPSPNELRIEIDVSRVAKLDGRADIVLHDSLLFSGGDIFALCLGVRVGGDGFSGSCGRSRGRFFCHSESGVKIMFLEVYLIDATKSVNSFCIVKISRNSMCAHSPNSPSALTAGIQQASIVFFFS